MKNNGLLDLSQLQSPQTDKLIANAERIDEKRQKQAWINRFGEKLVQLLFEPIAHPPEPKIYTIRNQDGTLVWKIYEPNTQQTLYMTSENEVRIWLDGGRYNQ